MRRLCAVAARGAGPCSGPALANDVDPMPLLGLSLSSLSEATGATLCSCTGAATSVSSLAEPSLIVSSSAVGRWRTVHERVHGPCDGMSPATHLGATPRLPGPLLLTPSSCRCQNRFPVHESPRSLYPGLLAPLPLRPSQIAQCSRMCLPPWPAEALSPRPRRAKRLARSRVEEDPAPVSVVAWPASFAHPATRGGERGT